jgi:WD40 repeat protein
MEARLAARLVEILAKAMYVAHHAGIIHRDLKPANILLGRKPSQLEVQSGAFPMGIPKITDFGLAKDIKGQSSQTQSGAILGTPNYMAPEQAAGKISEIGPSADTYALGAILYHCLTGRPPFQGEGPWDTIKQVINEDPLPPTRLRRGLPRDLEVICLRCLRKEPGKRYASALELADDLKRFQTGQTIHAKAVSDWERMVKWSRRNPEVAALSAAMILAIVGIVVLLGILWRLSAAERDVAVEQRDISREQRDEARLSYDRSRREAYAAQLNLVQNALHEAHFDRATEVLAGLKPKKGEEDLRGFEWFYLDRMSHSQLSLKGHTNLVSGLIFSPDGKRMTTSSLDGTVKVWDPTTGNEVLTLGGENGHHGPVRAVAYSADGKFLATGGEDGTARIWDAAKGTLVRVLTGHTGWINGLAFSPNGKRLATASEDRTARIWDLEKVEPEASGGVHPRRDKPGGSPLSTILSDHAYGVTSVAFSPNGKHLATGSWDRTARIWDAQTGKVEHVLTGHGHWVRAVAYSPDGKRLATASWDRTVRLWDPREGKELRTLKGYDSPVQTLVFSPDSQRLLTLSVDQSPRMWDLSSNENTPLRIGPGGPVSGISFSPDGQLLATVRFDFSGKGTDVDILLPGHTSSVHCVAFRPTSSKSKDPLQLASGSADATIRLWDPKTWEVQRILKGHEGVVKALAYSADGKFLASGSEDGTARIWDPDGDRALRVFSAHNGWVTSVAFSPDGKRLATGSEDHTVLVWDLTNSNSTSADPVPLLKLEQEKKSPVLALAWSPDGKRLVSAGSDGKLHIWDVEKGKLLKSVAGHQGQVRGLAFRPDGKSLASAGWDGKVHLWKTDDWSIQQTLRGHTYGVTGVVFSADGKRLASSSEDRTVKLWDVSSGRELLTLQGHAAGVTGVAFSSDSTFLASSCWDQKVHVWKAPHQR